MHILFSGCNDELPSREIHYIAGPWALIITSTAHKWDLIIMSCRRFFDVLSWTYFVFKTVLFDVIDIEGFTFTHLW